MQQLTYSLAAKLLMDGGFSYSPKLERFLTSVDAGYVVSLPRKDGFEFVSLNNDSATVAVDVYRYLGRPEVVEALKHPDALLGGWVDSGKVYLDVSRRYNVRCEAEHFARLGEQAAFFDLQKGESVHV